MSCYNFPNLSVQSVTIAAASPPKRVTFVVAFNNSESAAEFKPPFPYELIQPVLNISSNVILYDVEVGDAELASRILTSEWYCGDVISLHILEN